MTSPVQVTFRNMTPIDSVRKDIESRVQKLETFCKPIVSYRIVVEAPTNHHRKSNPFKIRIDTTLTDGKVLVKYDESAYPELRDNGGEPFHKGFDTTSRRNCLMLTIREAFDAARRKLQDHARRRRYDIKTHSDASSAVVSRIYPNRNFGYLETPDGREIYFHANSVLGGRFQSLKPGSRASFVEESGVKGPQASTVRIRN